MLRALLRKSLLCGVASLSVICCTAGDGSQADTVTLTADDAEVEQLYERGVLYAKQKEFSKAVDAFTEALSHGRYTFELLLMRSRSYLELKQYESALADASSAIYLRPRNPIGYMLRAAVYGRMDHVNGVVADATRAIQLNPTVGEYYVTRAAGYLRLGEPEKALNDLTAALSLGENNSDVYLDRGLAWKQLGRYEEALKDYSKSLELEPGSYLGLLRRGIVYRCLGQPRKAIGEFSAILAHNSPDLEARLQRAAAYTEAEDFSAALSDLRYGIEHDFRDPYMYLNLAYLYYRRNGIDEALAANNSAMSLSNEPMRAAVLFQKGLILFKQGNEEEARKAYEEGRQMVVKTGAISGLDDGIDDLRLAADLNGRGKDVVRQVLDDLEETRTMLAPQTKPNRARCFKLRL